MVLHHTAKAYIKLKTFAHDLFQNCPVALTFSTENAIDELCTQSQHDLAIGMSVNGDHHSDAIMSAMASFIASPMSDYSIVSSSADQRKHQNSTSLAFLRGIHRWPVNSPDKWPVTRKMFPFMTSSCLIWVQGKSGTNILYCNTPHRIDITMLSNVWWYDKIQNILIHI